MALGEGVALGEDAVDAVAHGDAVVVRFDVDVRRALAQGLHEDAVDELDDRRVDAVAHDLLAREFGEVVHLFDGVQRILPDSALDVIEAADEVLYLGGGEEPGVGAGSH